MTILEKISSRKARVGILGLGYVGLPLLVSISKGGFDSVGFDINSGLVKELNGGQSRIESVSNDDIKILQNGSRFRVSDQASSLNDCDIFIICVPTPLDRNLNPDTSFVWSAINIIVKNTKKKDLLILLESTTYPGHTREIGDYLKKIAPRINIAMGFSPEREDPGNKNFKTQRIPKIISALNEDDLPLVESFYSSVFSTVVPVSSTEVAEFTKLFENTFRSVNIGFVNEMKILSDKFGIDIFEVISAAKTKPFGFMPFYPGPGLGGHCIPIDPFYLNHAAKPHGLNAKFIELSGEINRSMPEFVVSKVILALNSIKTSVAGSNIAIWGLSYKPGIRDTRESPSIALADELQKLGAHLVFVDPYQNSETFQGFQIITNTDLLTEKNFDLSIISTLHPEFSEQLILGCSNLIVDTRGLLEPDNQKIWRS